jgi:cysteine desulfurase
MQTLLLSTPDETVALCSVMAANNETGVIQDVQTVSQLCKEYDIYFHCDATQVIGKTIFDFSAVYADSYTLSAHKFYGMKGSAALIYRAKPKPIFYGGMQENNLRAGTENVLAILSLQRKLSLQEL